MALIQELTHNAGACHAIQKANLSIQRYGSCYSVLTVAAMMDAMGLDKKVVDGRLRFIVASELGEVAVRDDIDGAVVRDVLSQCC